MMINFFQFDIAPEVFNWGAGSLGGRKLYSNFSVVQSKSELKPDNDFLSLKIYFIIIVSTFFSNYATIEFAYGILKFCFLIQLQGTFIRKGCIW